MRTPATIRIQGEVEEFLRKCLTERLERVTEEQRKFFWEKINPVSMYPKGVPVDRLKDAIDLCDRTIRKNEQGK